MKIQKSPSTCTSTPLAPPRFVDDVGFVYCPNWFCRGMYSVLTHEFLKVCIEVMHLCAQISHPRSITHFDKSNMPDKFVKFAGWWKAWLWDRSICNLRYHEVYIFMNHFLSKGGPVAVADFPVQFISLVFLPFIWHHLGAALSRGDWWICGLRGFYLCVMINSSDAADDFSSFKVLVLAHDGFRLLGFQSGCISGMQWPLGHPRLFCNDPLVTHFFLDCRMHHEIVHLPVILMWLGALAAVLQVCETSYLYIVCWKCMGGGSITSCSRLKGKPGYITISYNYDKTGPILLQSYCVGHWLWEHRRYWVLQEDSFLMEKYTAGSIGTCMNSSPLTTIHWVENL